MIDARTMALYEDLLAHAVPWQVVGLIGVNPQGQPITVEYSYEDFKQQVEALRIERAQGRKGQDD